MESLFYKLLAKNKCISGCLFCRSLGLSDVLVVVNEGSKLKMALTYLNLKFFFFFLTITMFFKKCQGSVLVLETWRQSLNCRRLAVNV